ncbi:MAG TPA: outer membrane beta-barrel protein [Rhodothermales bacterium]|nr:outer membrane beta-barrel protein [Rhodothermales bacterium]
MRTSLLLLVLAASVSGCAVLRDPAVTAGATLGTDNRGQNTGMPLGGGFVGVRTRLVGLEGGVEAGRRINRIDHVDAGPTRQRETAVQAYVNARYVVDHPVGHRSRLYVLAGARHYYGSIMYTDSAEYGIDPDDTRVADHGVFLNAGVGVGYGPVAIEALTPVPFLRDAHPLYTGLALRARVSVPLLRLGEQ